MPLEINFIEHIDAVTRQEYQQLQQQHCPFLRREFLLALEQQQCVGGNSGWQPQYLTVRENGRLIALSPCYKKTHSYGEYVFDFAWADAYQRHQLDYYPKLVAAIPFTPVPGSRLITTTILRPEQKNEIFAAIDACLQQHSLSSMHWLFIPEAQQQELQQAGYVLRKSVQFHWFNHDYQHFDDFLMQCTSRKRKSIKRERRKVTDAGIHIRQMAGKEINAEDMQDFYTCYQSTYLKRSGHGGYLTLAFFEQLRQTMPEQLMLVTACRGDNLIASALFFTDDDTLYGRYWGCLEEVDALHFECCFYQGIEFCIDNRLSLFNPGTQGEHKILRGFEPVWCYSAHKLMEPAFHEAIKGFVIEEATQLTAYKNQAQNLLPYKNDLSR